MDFYGLRCKLNIRLSKGCIKLVAVFLIVVAGFSRILEVVLEFFSLHIVPLTVLTISITSYTKILFQIFGPFHWVRVSRSGLRSRFSSLGLGSAGPHFLLRRLLA